MPSAQVIDINAPPSAPPSPPPQHIPVWLKMWLWWKHHKFVAATVGCILVALLTILVVSVPHRAGQSYLSFPTTQPTSTPTPTPDNSQLSQENKFYAALPETLLYYSYAQTTNSQNIFQSDPTNEHRRGLTIGLPNKYAYATSPDGQQIVRWTDSTIEISSQPDLEKFSSLFTSPSSPARINSVIWSQDSKNIAFNLSQATNEQTGGLGQTYKNALYTLQIGQKPHQVLNQTKLFQYHLLAYTQSQKLYFAEESMGALSNVQQLDPTSASIADSFSFLPNLAQNHVAFNQDMTLAVGFNQTQVTLYQLTDKSSKVIYTLNHSCPFDTQKNNSAITAAAMAPDASGIIWSTNFQPCNPDNIDPKAPTDSITEYDMAHQSATQIWAGHRVSPVNQLIWPPSAQWVWVSSTELSQLLDIKSGKLYSVPKQREQNIGRDRVYYIGWLLGKKGEDATPTSSPSPGS